MLICFFVLRLYVRSLTQIERKWRRIFSASRSASDENERGHFGSNADDVPSSSFPGLVKKEASHKRTHLFLFFFFLLSSSSSLAIEWTKGTTLSFSRSTTRKHKILSLGFGLVMRVCVHFSVSITKNAPLSFKSSLDQSRYRQTAKVIIDTPYSSRLPGSVCVLSIGNSMIVFR